MIVITDRGTIDMNTFSRDYIQTSDEVYDANGHVIGTASAQVPVQPQSEQLTLDGENPLNDPSIYSTPPVGPNMPQSTAQIVQETTIPHYELIDKIFKKTDNKPVIKFEIEWADFPADKLQMLVDCFDVTADGMSLYGNKHFVNQDSVVESLNGFLKSKGVE